MRNLEETYKPSNIIKIKSFQTLLELKEQQIYINLKKRLIRRISQMVGTPIRKRETAGFFARKLALNQIIMEIIIVS